MYDTAPIQYNYIIKNKQMNLTKFKFEIVYSKMVLKSYIQKGIKRL